MITLNGDSGITTPSYGGTDAAEYLVPVTAFKNRIINGAMQIDQRNAGASVNMASGDGGYCLDRWRTQKNGSGVLALQQTSTAPAGFASSLKVTVSTSSTPAAGDYYTIGQIIEGNNFADMAWGTLSNQPITISFWVQSSVTGTYTASVYNWGISYTYPSTFTINSANTWEQKTITISGATSSASGTWATGNTGSLYLRIDLGSGSNYSTSTANAWNSTGGFRVNGSVNLVSNASATFYITGVQLEKGSTATSFDYRPYGTELALCQRYCPVWDYNGSYTTVCLAHATAPSQAFAALPYVVTPRVVPTGVTITGNYTFLTAAYGIGTVFTPTISTYSSLSALGLTTASASGLAAGNVTTLACASTGKIIATGCEL